MRNTQRADGELEYLIARHPLAYVQDVAAAMSEVRAAAGPGDDEAPDTERDPATAVTLLCAS